MIYIAFVAHLWLQVGCKLFANLLLICTLDEAVCHDFFPQSTLKKKSIRSTSSKAEKRLSQQIEVCNLRQKIACCSPLSNRTRRNDTHCSFFFQKDDSADLRCQLHFAKEELALMCKKLTKLVSESENMREELAKYRSAYGDVDLTQSLEGKQNSAHAREAEVKVHLKLVEEEATLLSRRIVELEVENRGLRAEMSDLREKTGRGGGGGEEDEEENRHVLEENLKDREGSLKTGCTKDTEKDKSETSSLCNQSQADGTMAACHITREGPVGGEWDPSDSPESDSDKNPDGALKGMKVKDFEALLALRDHSCILTSAIQLLMTPPKNGHCSPPSCAFTSPTEVDLNRKTQKMFPPGPLNEALELLQAMLLAFIGRVETILTGDDLGKVSGDVEALRRQECAEEREKQTRQATSFQWELIHSCREPKMRLCLQILGILHQWCQVNGPGLEGNEVIQSSKLFTFSKLRFIS